MISNFRCVLNVVFFLLGDSPASEFYASTFRNSLSLPAKPPMQMEQSVPKRRHMKFRNRGITKKKEYKAYIFVIILRQICRKWLVGSWTGSICLRTGTGGGHLRRCIQKSQGNAHNTQVACSSRVSR